MKRILTKKERDKKIRKNQLIIGSILILLMVFSTLGYALSGKEDEQISKIEYNEINFIKDKSGYWNFEINNQKFSTKYNPGEINERGISFFSYLNINSYKNKPLYFEGIGEPVYEIGKNLRSFVSRVQGACLSEENCEENLPIKNCSANNIIIIQEPDKNEREKIYTEDNCVFITASLSNQTMYADAFLFEILGIK